MSPTDTRITREDLEAAYSQVLGEGEAQAEAAVPKALVVVGAVALVVLTVAYLAGRRRGRNKSALIEIRRV